MTMQGANVAGARTDLLKLLGSAYHPPHSQDLSPCDYDLIPKLKEPLRGIRSRTVHDVLQTTDRPSQHPEIGQCQRYPMASTLLGTRDTQWWWLNRRPVKLKAL